MQPEEIQTDAHFGNNRDAIVPEHCWIAPAPGDLEACPRCGACIDIIIWGQSNCPNCGLHFECC